MNGFLLLIPFFLIQFTLLSKLDKASVKRAAHYPSMKGNEVITPKIYQLANIAIVICLLFLTIKKRPHGVFILL